MFVILGAINMFGGIACLAKDKHFPADELFTGNLTMWGTLLVFMAAAQIFTGISLYRRTVLGSVVGVFLAGLSLFLQLFLISTFPVWALTVITVDVLVIFSLTVHGYAFTE